LDDRLNSYVAEELAHREHCARLIGACFERSREELGELDAWTMFVQFAKAALPDSTIVGRDRDFEEQLLAAYETAGDSGRTQAAIEIGRRYRKPSEITLRRLARILCRRSAAASSKEQFRLAFGLDPLEKVKQAHDQFTQLSQDLKQDVGERPPQDFGNFLSRDTIGIPPPSDFVAASGSPADADHPAASEAPSPAEEVLAAGETESERPTAEIVKLRQSVNSAKREGSVPKRRRRDGAQ
jgi:hypothetical protein